MIERLAQAETYCPAYQEPSTGVTAVSFQVCRLTDGYWYDFNDSTFKSSGWTTKAQSMTEDDNGLWIYTTGWAVPDANAQYKIQFSVTDGSGTFYPEGPKIIVNSSYLDVLADLVNGGRLDLILDELTTQGDTNEGKLDTVDGIADAILTDTGTDIPATLSTIASYIDTEITSIISTLSTISGYVDELESRLTATRAGYLDNLSAGSVAQASVCTEARLAELGSANLPTDIDTLISRLTSARAGYLDELGSANIPADIDTLISRLTSARAGYLDNLSAGAVGLASTLSTIDTIVDELRVALVNKQVINESTGAVELFNESNVSLGSVSAGLSSSGGYTTKKRMAI